MSPRGVITFVLGRLFVKSHFTDRKRFLILRDNCHNGPKHIPVVICCCLREKEFFVVVLHTESEAMNRDESRVN